MLNSKHASSRHIIFRNIICHLAPHQNVDCDLLPGECVRIHARSGCNIGRGISLKCRELRLMPDLQSVPVLDGFLETSSVGVELGNMMFARTAGH